ncbi:1-(5-phosphoribosyl)-5-[(5-phosphoribosylamino)methylideneamino]imidazole-4-carboxamide isomerase [Prochlorococcus sp. MIT 1300]|uniref:1-(5-phosphoribosyl)-5-[(5- phosphoribosylamino)methylideneamino]imidazole-4- carboxamide isomerase n=1 Tax=Prochlorococcus sp. MIT 1300 TaxID=3096218 RepID=UPI002A747494|nr:1-(5-phosphoribosyl)-5-[(5-phosphoribosylamino)methylideneamino]imidazole-4-carboxamide isomerase [Prochlorococcus sp. MIT 1300]
MEIIPAIDLLDGNCVRLNQGDYNRVTHFNNDPVKQALYWQSQGATRLHLVDLDAARSGLPKNDSSILAIAKAVNIPIQLGGGVRTKERVKELIEYGLDKVILGTIAIEKPLMVKELADLYPQKIIVGIDAKNGKVATQGWLNQSDVLATELAKSFRDIDISSIICTDISTDGTLAGPNLQAMRDVAGVSNVPVIASGGVGSIADIIALLPLESIGVTGIIVGRALYDNAFELQEANKVVRNYNLQDPPKENVFNA